MIIFSERVNGMYRDVRGAIKERDKGIVQDLVAKQVDGGADVMDINIGPVKGDPAEHFVWLAQTVQEVTELPLSLDSAKANVLDEAVPKVKAALPDTKLVINSCTAAPDYMEKLVPLAAEHGCGIIGLTMDQDGVPGLTSINVDRARPGVYQAEMERLRVPGFSSFYLQNRKDFFDRVDKCLHIKDALYYLVGSDEFLSSMAYYLSGSGVPKSSLKIDKKPHKARAILDAV